MREVVTISVGAAHFGSPMPLATSPVQVRSPPPLPLSPASPMTPAWPIALGFGVGNLAHRFVNEIELGNKIFDLWSNDNDLIEAIQLLYPMVAKRGAGVQGAPMREPTAECNELFRIVFGLPDTTEHTPNALSCAFLNSKTRMENQLTTYLHESQGDLWGEDKAQNKSTKGVDPKQFVKDFANVLRWANFVFTRLTDQPIVCTHAAPRSSRDVGLDVLWHTQNRHSRAVAPNLSLLGRALVEQALRIVRSHSEDEASQIWKSKLQAQQPVNSSVQSATSQDDANALSGVCSEVASACRAYAGYIALRGGPAVYRQHCEKPFLDGVLKCIKEGQMGFSRLPSIVAVATFQARRYFNDGTIVALNKAVKQLLCDGDGLQQLVDAVPMGLKSYGIDWLKHVMQVLAEDMKAMGQVVRGLNSVIESELHIFGEELTRILETAVEESPHWTAFMEYVSKVQYYHHLYVVKALQNVAPKVRAKIAANVETVFGGCFTRATQGVSEILRGRRTAEFRSLPEALALLVHRMLSGRVDVPVGEGQDLVSIFRAMSCQMDPEHAELFLLHYQRALAHRLLKSSEQIERERLWATTLCKPLSRRTWGDFVHMFHDTSNFSTTDSKWIEHCKKTPHHEEAAKMLRVQVLRRNAWPALRQSSVNLVLPKPLSDLASMYEAYVRGMDNRRRLEWVIGAGTVTLCDTKTSPNVHITCSVDSAAALLHFNESGVWQVKTLASVLGIPNSNAAAALHPLLTGPRTRAVLRIQDEGKESPTTPQCETKGKAREVNAEDIIELNPAFATPQRHLRLPASRDVNALIECDVGLLTEIAAVRVAKKLKVFSFADLVRGVRAEVGEKFFASEGLVRRIKRRLESREYITAIPTPPNENDSMFNPNVGEMYQYCP